MQTNNQQVIGVNKHILPHILSSGIDTLTHPNIIVSPTHLETKLLNDSRNGGSPGSGSRLASIQCPADDSIPSLILSKLWATFGVELLPGHGIEIGSFTVSTQNFQTIESSQSKGNPDRLSGHNTCIGRDISFCSASITDQAGFALQSTLFDVEDHVATNEVVANWDTSTFIQDIKSNHDGVHLLLDSIPPESSACFLINLQGTLDSLGQLDTKLLVCPEIPLLHGLQDPVALPDGEWNPPLECRFIFELVVHRVLGNLQGIGLLDVLQLIPLSGVVLQPDQQPPALGSLLRNP